MANPKQIHEIVVKLSMLPNCPIVSAETSKAVHTMYFEALGDLPFEYVNAAYLNYISGNNPFFPSNPGVLREMAFDLELIALGVPTASQAWATILKGPAQIEARWCEAGADLRNRAGSAAPREYLGVVSDLANHERTCAVCIPASRDGSYGNNIVDEVVRLMGGPRVIFTDNLVADRARFMQSYPELVLAERRRLQMVPAVREFVSGSRPALVAQKMNLLAAKLGGDS